jgi:hypothetical protein
MTEEMSMNPLTGMLFSMRIKLSLLNSRPFRFRICGMLYAAGYFFGWLLAINFLPHCFSLKPSIQCTGFSFSSSSLR